jgi:hypothetical protein
VTVYVAGGDPGSGTLDLRATGDIVIDGTIDLSGAPGTENTITSQSTDTGRAGSGGFTGEPYASALESNACEFIAGNPGSLGFALGEKDAQGGWTNQGGHAKVRVAERLASWICPRDLRVRVYRSNVTSPDAALALGACDVIFLAADSMQARHIVNAVCMQYLIPGFQVGAKVSLDTDGTVLDAFAVSRAIGPANLGARKRPPTSMCP